MIPGAHPRARRGPFPGAGGPGTSGSETGGSGPGRRAFLARTAGASLLAGGLAPLLGGCGTGYAAPPKHALLPSPKDPVRWPISPANQPIAGGLPPEANATLNVFTWPGHVSQRCLADFARAYRCQVRVATFATVTAALAALQRARGRFDVFMGAPTDIIGVLVDQSLIQPLNHSYIPNISEAWPPFTNPYYDSHWLYTVPYTVYTTGIAWRKDLVDLDPYSLANGWLFPWTARAAGRTGTLNDYRASIGMALMTSDPKNLNTADPYLIDQAEQALADLNGLVGGLRISNQPSLPIATGQSWIHLAWSGQVLRAAKRLPAGVPVEAIGYWFPPDGTGPVANDVNTVVRGARNPVLAHLLLNFMLDRANVMRNIAATGYTQPIVYATPRRLVYEGILPPSLTSAAVLSTFFDRGLKELEIPAPADQLWQQAWGRVTRQAARTLRAGSPARAGG